MRLKDIAEQIGVSLATVSRVMNGDKEFSVSKETEEKILQCAKELGYKPPQRKKREEKQSATGKRIGYILTTTKEKFEDSCFSTIIHGIETEALKHNCSIQFAHSVLDLSNANLLEHVLQTEADGIILIGNIPKDLYQLFTRRFTNAISIFDAPEEEAIDCITVEYEKPFYQLTKKMIACGRKKIAYIGGETYRVSLEEGSNLFDKKDERFQGYLKALIDSGISADCGIVKNGHWDMETSYLKMKEMLESEKEIDAVLAAGDKMALGAMRAISEKGLRIPQDISIAGFDNIETTNYVNPRLTTVNYPKEELGRQSVKMLLDCIKEKNACIGKRVILPSEIVERDSICPKE